MIRLSDAFIPSIYASYTSVDNPETSAFVRAGVIVNNTILNEIAKRGKSVTVPFWKDIDPSLEPNYSNDDPADLAVPNKIGSGTMSARTAYLNQGFGEMDLVNELVQTDPLQHVRNRFGTYWVRQQERRLIASCVGILADNIANDGGDMTVDISAQAGSAALFSGDAFVDASYTMGDQVENLTAIGIHSSVASRLDKNDDIQTVRDSEGRILLRTYKGRAVIVDDTLPTSGSGADRIYTSILFGRGAIGFGGIEGNAFAAGEGAPKVPAEVTRTAEAGNGGGSETIWERRTWIMHPFGYTWNDGPPSGAGSLAEFSPTLADLRLASHWDRVVSRKQVPLAFIRSKA